MAESNSWAVPTSPETTIRLTQVEFDRLQAGCKAGEAAKNTLARVERTLAAMENEAESGDGYSLRDKADISAAKRIRNAMEGAA